MKIILILFAVSATHSLAQSKAIDSTTIKPQQNHVDICPAYSTDTIPADFTAPGCEKILFWSVNSHKKSIWLRANFLIDDVFINQAPPIGFFISNKSASEVYLSFISQSHLLYRLEFGSYINPQYMRLDNYWRSTLTFGLFLVGALYFGFTFFLNRRELSTLFLSLASLFVSCQLVIEISRGLWAYSYPFQDLRLILITILSFCTGLSLAFHTIERFNNKKYLYTKTAMIFFTFWGILLSNDFDQKASSAILIPSFFAVIFSIKAFSLNKPEGLGYMIIFSCFTLTNIIAPNDFLDVNYYLILAALIIYLFLRQAKLLNDSIGKIEYQKSRRRLLESALEKASPVSRYFSLQNGNKIERILIDNINAFSGAGDYVTLHLIDHRELLYSTSLNLLEQNLPAGFLKVHRSHIVNTEQILKLTRLPNGSGELVLKNDYKLPVSRRIMPRVKKHIINY